MEQLNTVIFDIVIEFLLIFLLYSDTIKTSLYKFYTCAVIFFFSVVLLYVLPNMASPLIDFFLEMLLVFILLTDKWYNKIVSFVLVYILDSLLYQALALICDLILGFSIFVGMNTVKEKNIIKKFINKLDEETIQDILSTKYENIVEFIDEKEREQTEFKITEKTIEVDNQSIIKKLEDLVEIDEELENLYEKKDELLQLNNMYEMVKEQIEKSYQEMKENITPDFIEELKNILKKVTNGKYENIYLDNENNLLIEVEGGQYMPVDMLSSGTVDLIYLALRISAAKEISKETMPIIMDESFAYYDKERMTEILEYLSELENRQILIFTCSDREEKILEKEVIKYSKIEL